MENMLNKNLNSEEWRLRLNIMSLGQGRVFDCKEKAINYYQSLTVENCCSGFDELQGYNVKTKQMIEVINL